jgi:hypothetical protein
MTTIQQKTQNAKAFYGLQQKSLCKDSKCVEEWKYVNTYEDNPRVCICGRNGLKHCNLYFNIHTGEEVIVGGGCNVLLKPKSCVKKEDLPDEAKEILQAVVRFQKGYSKHMIQYLIDQYNKRLSFTVKSLEIRDISIDIKKIINNIKYNNGLMNQLVEFNRIVDAKYNRCLLNCNCCNRPIRDTWLNHPCYNFNCECLKIRKEYCLTCADMNNDNKIKIKKQVLPR